MSESRRVLVFSVQTGDTVSGPGILVPGGQTVGKKTIFDMQHIQDLGIHS